MLTFDSVQSIEKGVAKLGDDEIEGEIAFAKAGLDPEIPETVLWLAELLKREAGS